MENIMTVDRKRMLSFNCLLVLVVVVCSSISQVECQTTTTTLTPIGTSPSAVEVLNGATTPPPPSCTSHTACDTCVGNAKCLWCFTNNTCTDYPMSSLLPPASVCQLSHARWGVCWVNFEALLITMLVLGGTILMIITVCCCCCCSGCRNTYHFNVFRGSVL